jgi:hypothetical protein
MVNCFTGGMQLIAEAALAYAHHQYPLRHCVGIALPPTLVEFHKISNGH